MEVHHHPHPEKKNIKEYILEGLMIFIAVTLGFFAETIRESISEKKIEKEYIESFVADLKTDTAEFNQIIPIEEKSIRGLDTMLNTLILSSYTEENVRLMYYLCRKYTMSIDPMKYTLRTITQLKNSGGLRLISDKQASDSIIFYNKSVDDILVNLNFITNGFMIPAIKTGNKIFNPVFLIPYDGHSIASILSTTNRIGLLSTDRSLLAEYTNALYEVKNIRVNYLSQMKWQKERATDMIGFFQNTYHLKKE